MKKHIEELFRCTTCGRVWRSWDSANHCWMRCRAAVEKEQKKLSDIKEEEDIVYVTP